MNVVRVHLTRPGGATLSHNSRDKPAVERIAERLRRAGVEPWLDSWNLTPGGRWQDEIVEGLRGSSACAVFVGPHGLGDWVREELALALDRAAKDRAFRLFVVLLPVRAVGAVAGRGVRWLFQLPFRLFEFALRLIGLLVVAGLVLLLVVTLLSLFTSM